jgi:hypothetical protein
MSFCSAKIPILPFFRGKSESSTPPPTTTTTTKSFIEQRIYDLAVKNIFRCLAVGGKNENKTNV